MSGRDAPQRSVESTRAAEGGARQRPGRMRRLADGAGGTRRMPADGAGWCSAARRTGIGSRATATATTPHRRRARRGALTRSSRRWCEAGVVRRARPSAPRGGPMAGRHPPLLPELGGAGPAARRHRPARPPPAAARAGDARGVEPDLHLVTLLVELNKPAARRDPADGSAGRRPRRRADRGTAGPAAHQAVHGRSPAASAVAGPGPATSTGATPSTPTCATSCPSSGPSCPSG